MDLRFYRPNKTNNGSAIAFQIQNKPKTVGDKEYPDWMVFLNGAVQTGTDENDNASFAWKDKDKLVCLKLGEPDVGELLACLTGKKDFVGRDAAKGLYHQNSTGNSSLQFACTKEDGKPTGYKLRISSKKGDKLNAVSVMLSLADGELIRCYLELFLIKLFNA